MINRRCGDGGGSVPDLAREGGTRTSLWHWQHLRDPRAVNQRSVMPSFEHLVDRPIDFDDLQSPLDAGSPPAADAAREAEEIAADIVSQGGPLSTGGVLTLNSTAVALIAYLQRLGVAPEVAPSEPSELSQSPEQSPEQSQLPNQLDQSAVDSTDPLTADSLPAD